MSEHRGPCSCCSILIGKLKALHERCCPDSDDPEDHECLRCKTDWPCHHVRILDIGEARLREVQGE